MYIYQAFEKSGFSREDALCIERLITVKTDLPEMVPCLSVNDFRRRLISAIKGGKNEKVFKDWIVRENTTLRYLGDKFLELYFDYKCDFAELVSLVGCKSEGALLDHLGNEFFDEQESGSFESEKAEYYSEYLAYVANW